MGKDLSVLPDDVYRDTASHSQAPDGSPGPLTGKGGQEPDGLPVALDQHLAHTCRGTEIAVDLEGRMGIQQVRIQTAGSAGACGGVDPADPPLQQLQGMILWAEISDPRIRSPVRRS